MLPLLAAGHARLAASMPQRIAPSPSLACFLQASSKPHKETAAERLTTPTAMRMLKTLQQTQVRMLACGKQSLANFNSTVIA
jgi:hypothetical protein